MTDLLYDLNKFIILTEKDCNRTRWMFRVCDIKQIMEEKDGTARVFFTDDSSIVVEETFSALCKLL